MRLSVIFPGFLALFTLLACGNKPAGSQSTAAEQTGADSATAEPTNVYVAPLQYGDSPSRAREIFKDDPVVKLLNNEEYYALISADTNLLIVDVATPFEYKNTHIPRAVNVDFQAEDFEKKIGKLKRKTPVAIYCPSGIRSGEAAKKMKSMGFSTVYLLEYGIQSWRWSLDHTMGMQVGQPDPNQKKE